MTYSVDLAKQGTFVAPVSASIVCECDPDYNKKVNITVNVNNNVSHRGVQYVNLEVRPASLLSLLLFGHISARMCLLRFMACTCGLL
jgi:hypothetical protein